jgi:quinoprotein glucose dehydrogenase
MQSATGANTTPTRAAPAAAAPDVTAESVKSMKVAWRWAMPDNAIAADNAELRTWVNRSTPIAVDGVLYTTTPMSLVSAIDGATGKTLWTYDPKAYQDGTPPNLGFINRGLTYWEEGADKRLILGTGDGYLIVLDAKTGKPVKSWGDNGRVDLTKGCAAPSTAPWWRSLRLPSCVATRSSPASRFSTRLPWAVSP